MRFIVVRILALTVLALGVLPAAGDTAPPPSLLTIDGAIGPSTADYVGRALTEAQAAHAPFVVIRLDTPGGLSDSMRSIIQDILASPVPVVCWVGPQGARAASAGTYILYSCGLAAMAPGTNVGAATPVELSGLGGSDTPAKPKTAEDNKVLNDAIAYIRSLAQLRGRNAAWAEKAVRNGASLTAEDALKQHVVELLAPDLPALIQKIDGRSVPAAKGAVTLHTAGVKLSENAPNWRENFLGAITTPTIAYILFIIGIYGLLLEGLHPGFFLPGTVGAICLILALFAFHALPVNYAGLALIVLGAGMLVAEVFLPTFGTLGIGGIVAFVIGSIMLMNSHAPGYTLPRIYIGSIAVAFALVLGGGVYFIVRMRRRPVVSGREHMIGRPAIALEDFAQTGFVHIEGERWQARSPTPVHKGDTVLVEAMDGLILGVRPAASPKEK